MEAKDIKEQHGSVATITKASEKEIENVLNHQNKIQSV